MTNRRRTVAILVIVDMVVLATVSVPSIVAESEVDSYRCQSSLSSVCVVPGFPPNVKLETKYGALIPLHDMAFHKFILFAINGSMFFDVTGLAPSPDIALQFTAQSFGNGSLDIIIKGPTAFGITADNADQRVLSSHGSWGDGVEIVYTKAVSNDLLIVNYKGLGPGCYPVCNPLVPISPVLQYAILIFGLAILNAVSVVLNKLVRKPSRPTKAEKPESKNIKEI